MQKLINLIIFSIIILISVTSQAMDPAHMSRIVISNQSEQSILVAPLTNPGFILEPKEQSKIIGISPSIGNSDLYFSSTKGVYELKIVPLLDLFNPKIALCLLLARQAAFVTLEEKTMKFPHATVTVQLDAAHIATFVEREGVEETDEKHALLLKK
ncbi:MAG: hypothetical protein AB7F19_02465 [Candidatus Babeliales bacterium]